MNMRMCKGLEIRAVWMLVLCGLLGPVLLAQQSPPQPQRANKIYVKLRLDGLYPKTLTTTSGPVEIIFTNPTFLRPFDLVLRTGTGQNVAQTASGGRLRHRQNLKGELQPGRYQLQVAGQPSWTADLLVTPR